MKKGEYLQLSNFSPTKSDQENVELKLGSDPNSPQSPAINHFLLSVQKTSSLVHPEPVPSLPSTPNKTPTIGSTNGDIIESKKGSVYLRHIFKWRYSICCTLILMMIGVIIYILVVIVDKTEPNSNPSNKPTDYISSVVYTDSSCTSDTAIYQEAYPLNQCLTYFVDGNAVYSKLFRNTQASSSSGSTTNVTDYSYGQTKCQLSQLSNYQVLRYNRCIALTQYPGYYQKFIYYNSGYQSVLTSSTSLLIDGFADSSCGSYAMTTNIQLLTCIPTATNKAVMYTIESPSNVLTQKVYNDRSCSNAPVTTTTVNQASGCVKATGVRATVSPYRNKDTLDCFTALSV